MLKGNLTEGPLLDEKGHLIQAGWSTKLVKKYDRNAIKVSPLKIKEWDYYIVGNDKYAIALTVADNGYMGLASISWLDFVNAKYKTSSKIVPLTLGRLKMPSSCYEGDVSFDSSDVQINFYKDENCRRLVCYYKNFWSGLDLSASILLTDFPEDEMVIATPWAENKNAFYYNNKTNCMTATGFVKLGNESFTFSPEESQGTLDWGRGVWTYKNTWYWGSMSTYLGDKKFSFNIGYGFGDRSSGTENMIFYQGKAHKIDQVTFLIPKDEKGKDDFLKPWQFTSNDGRFEMRFTPIFDRKDIMDLGILASHQHQVFGKFAGKAVLDDGTVLQITDKIGFAEKVKNKW